MMEDKLFAERFWKSLARKVKKFPEGLHLLEEIRKGGMGADYAGLEVLYLKKGSSLEKAKEMIAAGIEYVSYLKRQKRAGEKRMLKEKDFWLTFMEETGMDGDSNLVFDPRRMAVVCRRKEDQASEWHQASLEAYRNLIVEALSDLFAASRMATDPFFKFKEIKELANAITEGDFKPKLRGMVQEWVNDPFKARDCQALLPKEDMPQWLIAIATRLGQRKKWGLN